MAAQIDVQAAYPGSPVDMGLLRRLANTRVVKPTQRCHRCGAIVKKALSERTHKCACGCECGRDENAAKTLLCWSLKGMSWFAPGTGAARAYPLPETPPLAEG